MKNTVVLWSGVWCNDYTDFTRPMGPYQLAHWLRKHRIGCQVVEFVQLMSTKELIELTEMAIDSSTVAIGMSSTFWPRGGIIPGNIKAAMVSLKLKFPKLEFIIGGPKVPDSIRTHRIFDRVFDGDSENTLLKYCQEKKYNLSFPNEMFDIVNLDHRYSREDVILPGESLPLELGRGCIFRCKFCSYPNIGKKKHTYQRRPDLILEEIKWNYENFGTTNYLFMDDTVNEDVDKINFFTTIKEKTGVDITWAGFLRADLVWKHKNHNQLFDSGLRNAYFGIETLHPLTANLIGKAWNGKHGRDCIPVIYRDLWKKQVAIEATFIAGLPGEPEESMFESAKWIKELDAGLISFLAFNLKQHESNDERSSEFTRNYANYGYTIKENGKWVHTSGMTEERAHEITEELNKTIRPYWRVGGWRSGSFYNNGYSMEETRNINVYQGTQVLETKREEFKDRYIKLYKEIVSR